MTSPEVTLLDYLTKKELVAESQKKPRERCEIYRCAYAHMIHGGPDYERLSGILDAKCSKCQHPLKNPEWWKDATLKEELKLYFEMYLEYVAEQRVVVREIERDPDTHLPYPIGKGRGKAHYMPYTTRFDGNYGTETQKKLRRIKIKFGSFLTLTVAARKFDNIHEATEALKKGWNRIHRSMNRRFGNLSYLSVLEFGGENDMPHLHILIDRIHFNKEDIVWLRKLWQKSVGTFINVRQIRDLNAGKYALKYLEKTFAEGGSALLDGNAWAYWITNSKFYSMSHDVKEMTFNNAEMIWDVILAAETHYNDLMRSLEPRQFEYIGIACLSDLGDPPPKILTDKWLLEKGWMYSEEHECWFYAGLGDSN